MKITDLSVSEFNTLFSPDALLDAALARSDKNSAYWSLSRTGKSAQNAAAAATTAAAPAATTAPTGAAAPSAAVRASILLLSAEGMSAKHIAAIFNLRLSAVRKIIRAARSALEEDNE